MEVKTKNNDYFQRVDETVMTALKSLEFSLYDVPRKLLNPIFFITTPSGYPFPITNANGIKNPDSLGTAFAKELKELGLEQAIVGGTYYKYDGWGCVNRTLDDFKNAKIVAKPIRGLTYMDLVPENLDLK